MGCQMAFQSVNWMELLKAAPTAFQMVGLKVDLMALLRVGLMEFLKAFQRE